MNSVVQDALDKYLSRYNAGEAIDDEAFVSQYPTAVHDGIRAAIAKAKRLPQQCEYATVAANSAASEVGSLASKLPEYELTRFVSRGGFGSVWLGRNRFTGRAVAVKILHEANADVDLDGLREYERFAKDRGNLVEILHAGSIDGIFYYCMPRADNDAESSDERDYKAVTLESLVKGDLDRVVGALRSIVLALEQLHEAGLAHWDVKPGNVLRIKNEWCLADLGLVTSKAKRFKLRGTRGFIPPEMERDSVAVDGVTADVYAAGVTAFHLFTGRNVRELRSFLDETPGAVPVSSKEVRLHEIIRRACDPEPRNRYRCMSDMRRELEELIGDAVAASSSAIPNVWIIGSIALLAAAGIAAFLLWQYVASSPSAVNNVSAAVESSPKAQLAIRVWKKSDPKVGLVIDQDGAVPLSAGDFMRVEVTSDRPAYHYVIYLEANGEPAPLYPWRKYDWSNRQSELPTAKVYLPEDPLKDASPLSPGPSGAEAILLMTRETPLSEDENAALKAIFQDWTKPSQVLKLHGAVVLAGDARLERFTDSRDRGKLTLEHATQVDDPIQRVRRLMAGPLKPMFRDLHAVCYPFQGTK